MPGLIIFRIIVLALPKALVFLVVEVRPDLLF